MANWTRRSVFMQFIKYPSIPRADQEIRPRGRGVVPLKEGRGRGGVFVFDFKSLQKGLKRLSRIRFKGSLGSLGLYSSP